jgi:hypothetical protein
MSTIIASNVSDGTLSIPTTYVTNGSAKAWATINQTGTQAVNDSLNLSSIVDNGTGLTQLSFTSSFTDADGYNVSFGSRDNGAGGGVGCAMRNTTAPTAGGFLLICFSNTFNFFDGTRAMAAVQGDLA